MDQKPSVGRIVHYVSYGTPNGEYTSKCVAAIITEVVFSENLKRDVVRLKIFNPDGDFNSPYLDEDDYPARLSKDPGAAPPKPGTWHWPERV